MDSFKVLPAKPDAQNLAAKAGDTHDEKTFEFQDGALRRYRHDKLHQEILSLFKTEYVRT